MEEFEYELSLSPNSMLLINKKYILAKMNFNASNDRIMSFLFQNINQTVSKQKINEKLGVNITGTLSDTFSNVNLKGVFRKAFLNVSKNKVLLRNKVHRADFKKLGITHKEFREKLEGLKKVI